MKDHSKDSVTDYILRSLDILRSREFIINMIFRFIFGFLLIFEIVLATVASPVDRYGGSTGDFDFFTYQKISGLALVFWIITTFLAVFWYGNNYITRERLRALRSAIKSTSTLREIEEFEFFEISRNYSFDVGMGQTFTFIARVEPAVWWGMTFLIGLIVLDQFGVLL